jgi:hypothetical protein
MDTCQYAASSCGDHTLPMTGMDVAALVFVAVAIIICGVVLRLQGR